MKNKILLTLAIATIALVGCKKDELIIFDGETTLNFVKSGYVGTSANDRTWTDTLQINSAYYGGKDMVDIEVPMRMSGKIVDYPRDFKVELIPEKGRGNIVEGTHYSFERNQVLEAGKFDKTLIVKVDIAQLKADRIDGLIVIGVIANEHFALGVEKYRSIGLYLSGLGFGTTPPNFFNVNGLTAYLGTYNRFVLEKFAEYAEVDSEIWYNGNHFLRYESSKKAYIWFKANPTNKTTGEPTTDADVNKIVVKGTVYSYE